MKRVFNVLLHAYPRRFRDAYEDDLHAFFEEQRRDPRYRGVFGGLRLWAEIVVDVLRNAARLHFERPKRPRKRRGEITIS